MEGLLLIVIPVALLLLFGVALVMLLDMTLLRGDRRVEEREREARRWSPPSIRGSELLRWAREAGARAVREELHSGVGPDTPARVSAKLHDGATRAMLASLSERDATRKVPCPEGGQGSVGVTALEAIALAQRIRAKLLPKEREAVLLRAREVADRPAARVSGAPACALQGDGCVCLFYDARPLRCRPLHASTLLDRSGLVSGAAAGGTTLSAHARLVAEGVEEGAGRALEESGLDGKVYELNSALAVALGTSNVVERWAVGEDIFATCLPAAESALQH